MMIDPKIVGYDELISFDLSCVMNAETDYANARVITITACTSPISLGQRPVRDFLRSKTMVVVFVILRAFACAYVSFVARAHIFATCERSGKPIPVKRKRGSYGI